MNTSRRVILQRTGAFALFASGGMPDPSVKRITAVSLSGYSTSGTEDNTVVGTVSVQTNISGATFDGTLTLAGTDAAKFKLVGGGPTPTVVLNGAQPLGTYSISLIPTDASFVNSGGTFALPSTVTVLAAGAAHLWDLTATNDTGSTQTAGTYWLMRGLVFADGDLTAGTYPTLKVGSTVQSYTPHSIVNWPSGAVRSMGAVILPSFSLSAGASTVIEVWNSGIAPAASGRTLTDLYAQSLSVQADPAAVASNLVAGTWGMWAAADANNYAQYSLGDGTAGRVYKLHLKAAQAQGAAAHGQLECELYVVLLNDAAGNLGAIGCNARLVQPYYNNDTPAKNWRAFSAIRFEHGAGPTALDFVGPLNDGTYSPVTFTHIAGTSTFHTIATNKFWNGGSSSSWGQLNACYFTTTGTLPAGLTTGQIYFSRINKASTVLMEFSTASNFSTGPKAVTDAGTGTHTINPVHVCLPFCSVFGATSAALWRVFQGTGSVASPAWGRATYNQAYWQSTKIFGAIDLSLIGAITNGVYPYIWNPQSIGPIHAHQQDSGGRPELAVFSGYAIRHFYTQSLVDELIVRTIAYGAAHEGFNFKDKTGYNSVPPNYINLSASNYTGMAPASAVQQSVAWIPAAGTWTAPPAVCKVPFFDQNTMSHCPEFCAYAALVTGEPQFYDLNTEMGLGGVLATITTWRNTTTPVVKKGIVVAYDTQVRPPAWALRNMILAAALRVDYDGSAFSTYIKDLVAANTAWMIDQALGVQLNSYLRGIGFWMMSRNGTQFGTIQKFEYVYHILATRLASVLLADAKATSFLSNMNTLFNHLLGLPGGGWFIATAYILHNCRGQSPNNQEGTGQITADADIAATSTIGSTSIPALTWGTASPAFTLASKGNFGYIGPVDGDKVLFPTNAVPAGGDYAADIPYQMVNSNASTRQFDLAPWGGGATIAPPSVSGSAPLGGNGPYILPGASSTTANSGGNTTGSDTYIGQVLCALLEIKALGITGLSGEDMQPVITDLAARQAASSPGFPPWDQNPAWARQATYA